MYEIYTQQKVTEEQGMALLLFFHSCQIRRSSDASSFSLRSHSPCISIGHSHLKGGAAERACWRRLERVLALFAFLRSTGREIHRLCEVAHRALSSRRLRMLQFAALQFICCRSHGTHGDSQARARRGRKSPCVTVAGHYSCVTFCLIRRCLIRREAALVIVRACW